MKDDLMNWTKNERKLDSRVYDRDDQDDREDRDDRDDPSDQDDRDDPSDPNDREDQDDPSDRVLCPINFGINVHMANEISVPKDIWYLTT